MRIVVGLGNPGKKYEKTRHNIGARVVEKFGEKESAAFRSTSLEARLANVAAFQDPVLLLLSKTFMNNSGVAVRKVLDYYKAETSSLLLVHDDLDLDLGQIKFSHSSSSGGHRGVESVIESIGSNDFGRLRLGIGRPSPGGDVVDFVLTPFPKEEWEGVEALEEKALEALKHFLVSGTASAMTLYNKRQ